MHCIYFKVKKEEERPWNCKPSSKSCISKYCPHLIDAKKFRKLVTNALNPEVTIRRTEGCNKPFDKHHIRTVTSSSQPDG